MSLSHRWFVIGCAFEASLVALAAILAWATGQRLFADFQWNGAGLAWGTAAALPLLALFRMLVHSRRPALERIGDFLEGFVRPVFGPWRWWQLALISTLAGVGEELLFRAVLQTWLAGWLDMFWGLLLASLLFGLGHRVTWAYAALAAAIGLYLGSLWLLAGNLLAPMVAHALYDFLALRYFLRSPPRPPMTTGWQPPGRALCSARQCHKHEDEDSPGKPG